MAYRLPAHLHRSRHGTLYFRIAIPTDLRHHFGMAEVYRTLRTARVVDAALSAQTLALSFKTLFRQLREESMCATKKNQSTNNIRFGWTTEINLDEFRRPKSVKFTSEPGDPPGAMAAAIREVLDSTPAARPPEVSVDSAIVQVTQPLSTYVEPYLANAFKASMPDEKTLESYRATIRLFIEIIGDKPLHKLNVADQNRYEDTIVRVPTNRTKIALTRSLSIDEMVALEVPKISPQTVKNNAQRTNNFLTWAFRREGGKPPFELLNNMRITARSKMVQRRAFTEDELRTLFNTSTYAQGRQQSPYMYWLPLIGLHSGMRINEIAQLELSDITSHGGVACFNVNDDGTDDGQERRQKRVKTGAGRRIVPIHDALIDLGLLDYATIVQQAGHRTLFPELLGGRDGPGQAASKQFARYCDRVGLSDPALVFHSFRHGTVGCMRAAGIAKELRMVVVGHSAAEDVHDGYGDIKNDFTVADRKRAIDALRFDNVLEYDALKKLRPGLAELRSALHRVKVRQRELKKNGQV